MNIRNTLTDATMKAANFVHRGVLTLSGGRIGGSWGRLRTVELHTVGRTSGKRRSTLLTAPIHDDDRYVLVASKGGDDRHPQWYLNLVANPEIELTVGGTTIPMRARTATPVEKAQLWHEIVDVYKGYASYQAKTERDIPVVICEPIDD